jgi:hypothetical protein
MTMAGLNACVNTANDGIGVVGGVKGGSVPSCSTIPQTNMATFADPFASLVEPKVPGTKKGRYLFSALIPLFTK